MSLENSVQAAGTVRYAKHYEGTQVSNATRKASWYAPGYAPKFGESSTRVAAATYSDGLYTSSTASTGSFSDALTSASDALDAQQTVTDTYAYAPYTDGTQQKSDYDAATGRQYTYIENHASGYTGMGYYDERGRAFTDYGSYLREDGFYYPSGAKISKNGMYTDTGSGWQFAKDCDAFGLAPGTRLDLLPGWQFGR